MEEKKDDKKNVTPPVQPAEHSSQIPPAPANPDPFLIFGYRAAISLAFLGIILSSAYLFVFIAKSNPAEIKLITEAAYSAERKTVLLSTAIFVAMSFGFLGFGLFLIQAKGEVDGNATFGEHIKVSFTKLSPGLFVILCATVIIVFAITHDIEYKETYNTGTQQNGGKRDSIPPDTDGPGYQRHPQPKPAIKPPKTNKGHKS